MPVHLRRSLLRLASDLPVGDSTRREILRAVQAPQERSSGHEKRAEWDFQGKAWGVLNALHGQFEAKVDAAFKKLLDQLEKRLLRLDLVMDRRGTYLGWHPHHEGPRVEGVLKFVDKRDHGVRGRDELRELLEQVGLYLSNPKQDGRGVWSVGFGE